MSTKRRTADPKILSDLPQTDFFQSKELANQRLQVNDSVSQQDRFGLSQIKLEGGRPSIDTKQRNSLALYGQHYSQTPTSFKTMRVVQMQKSEEVARAEASSSLLNPLESESYGKTLRQKGASLDQTKKCTGQYVDSEPTGMSDLVYKESAYKPEETPKNALANDSRSHTEVFARNSTSLNN